MPLSMKLYAAGLAGALGHLVFIPWVASPIQNIVEARDENTRPCEGMEGWLKVHRLRMVVADVPSWLLFLAADLAIPAL